MNDQNLAVQDFINVQQLLSKREMFDLPDARAWLADVLDKKGFSKAIIEAFKTIPRHAFAEARLSQLAYEDKYLWTRDTVLTTPNVVAQMMQQLDLNKEKRVLEIGTGTGYQTALLSMLASHVFTVDRVKSCIEEAKEAVDELNIKNAHFKLGDGFEGWPSEAPFDAILIACAVPFIPKELVKQLNPQNGRMVVPIGAETGGQRLILVKRRGDNITTIDLGLTYFVPMVPAGSWNQTNQFQEPPVIGS